ncbi:hypothetical protein FLONG3_1384 [Fusarium longipes]|uniref:Pentatricopeptide repeat domain-containing protein n=1 Tax=Fusarium longipes TaxID=694270 RepID=A0A395T7P8_9HYPO|nr:hypothetical protein FLONG3_1384 [Fusarium longipes]
MHQIPTILRARQYSYARCIRIIAQKRLRYATPSLLVTNLYSNKRCIYSTKVDENARRRNSPGPAPPKKRAAQHNDSQRTKIKSLIPLGVRLNGSGETNTSSQNTVSDRVSSWERRIVTTRHSHGDRGAWDIFLQLQSEGDAHLVTEPRAEFLRDSILKAALTHADRMEEVFTFAQELQKTYHFEWPELYLKVVHFYLAQTDCEAAFRWHLKLMPTFRPDLNSFGAFLASFAIDFSPNIQSTLTRIYVFNPYRELYDYVVPTLFDSGQSHAARVWRKRFILFNDHAVSQKSMPFLDFLSRYFPKVQLTKEELAILNRDAGVYDDVAALDTPGNDGRSHQQKGMFSDKFTARWFASSWTSSEFAINLMHKLGLREVGSQSLQSVALREDDAQGINDRLAQFRELGIAISPTVYCKAVISFAERGEDELLRNLLHCDIHPDEFDNSGTRVALLAASAKQQDWRLERLLQEVEALVTKMTPRREKNLSSDLNKNLRAALSTQGLAKVRSVFDKMDNLSVNIEQKNSEILLARVFEGIWYHPKNSKQKVHGYQEDPQLDRAIHLSLRVARHGAAIPIRYWQILLYNLGRLGRFNELEELSHEICELYSPEPGGLIPVHRCDMPPKPKAKAKISKNDTGGWAEYHSFPDGKKKISHFREEFWRAEIGLTEEEPSAITPEEEPAVKSGDLSKRGNDPDYTFCIPADLPFTNRQHPIQKIFDVSLQRAILRWGFDKTLGQEPAQLSLAKVKPGGITDFDLACGVRLLALLRDKGVYIDQQVVRSAIIKRLAVASLPGRARARARDDRELSPSNIKQLVEKAWGFAVLPSETQLALEIENMKPKLWKSFPKLFEKSYDKDETSWRAMHATNYHRKKTT